MCLRFFETRRFSMPLWMKTKWARHLVLSLISVLLSIATLLAFPQTSTPAAALAAQDGPSATVSTATAVDASLPLRDLAQLASTNQLGMPPEDANDGPRPPDTGFTGDGAVQTALGPQTSP